MSKKNQQYYRSKKRVLKYRHIDTDKAVAAIRLATEAVLSAIQISIALSTPRPKFDKGGAYINKAIPERSHELIISPDGKITSVPQKADPV